jgi:hypothetical protein
MVDFSEIHNSLNEAITGFQLMSSTLGVPPPPGMVGGRSGPYVPPPLPILQVPPPPMVHIQQPPSHLVNMAAAQVNTQPLMQAQAAQVRQGYPAMNLPQPQMMTDPMYGSYRSAQPLPPPPAIRVPFGNMLPPPPVPQQFHSQMGYGVAQAVSTQQMMQAQQEAARRAGAEALATGAGAYVGAGIGGALGMLGGVKGAWMGAQVGGLAGGALGSSIPGLTSAVGWLNEPGLRQQAEAMRLQRFSRNFVGGGAGVDAVTGRGLSPIAATQLTQQLGGMSTDSMNSTDIMNLTQMSSESGLLNMAQDPERILKSMKDVIKVVGSIAKMTGDPDFRTAITHIAEMRNLGLTVPEVGKMLSGAGGMARIAGTNVMGLAGQGGMSGALTFQGAGMTGGTGMQAGMWAQGAMRSLVGGGGLTARELNLVGGESGGAQRLNQAMAGAMAGSAGTLALASMMKMGPGGQLVFDKNMAAQVMGGGEININELARRASSNLNDRNAIEQFTMNKDVNRDIMARELGPMGMMRMLGGMGQWMQKEHGLESLGAGLKMLNMPTRTANLLERQLQDPSFYQDQVKQLQVDRMRRGAQQREEFENLPGYWGGRDRGWNKFGRGVSNFFAPMGRESISRGLALENARKAETARYGALGIDVEADEFTLLGKRGAALGTLGSGGGSRMINPALQAELFPDLGGSYSGSLNPAEGERRDFMRAARGDMFTSWGQWNRNKGFFTPVPGQEVDKALAGVRSSLQLVSGARQAGAGTRANLALSGSGLTAGSVKTLLDAAGSAADNSLDKMFRNVDATVFSTQFMTKARNSLSAEDRTAFDKMVAENPNFAADLLGRVADPTVLKREQGNLSALAASGAGVDSRNVLGLMKMSKEGRAQERSDVAQLFRQNVGLGFDSSKSWFTTDNTEGATLRGAQEMAATVQEFVTEELGGNADPAKVRKLVTTLSAIASGGADEAGNLGLAAMEDPDIRRFLERKGVAGKFGGLQQGFLENASTSQFIEGDIDQGLGLKARKEAFGRTFDLVAMNQRESVISKIVTRDTTMSRGQLRQGSALEDYISSAKGQEVLGRGSTLESLRAEYTGIIPSGASEGTMTPIDSAAAKKDLAKEKEIVSMMAQFAPRVQRSAEDFENAAVIILKAAKIFSPGSIDSRLDAQGKKGPWVE